MSDTIRGLVRGLEVLESLETSISLSLADLHTRTGLPKPTLLRILATLQSRGYVRRRLTDGTWRRVSRLGNDTQNRINDQLVDIAEPILEELRSTLIWPSDLAVYRDGMMELLDTTARRVPIMVDKVFIGHRVHIMPTGIGRCYLAFCSEEEREMILDRLACSNDPFDRPARDRRAVIEMLTLTRSRGYALRARGYSNFSGSMLSQMSGAGVPIMVDEKAVACLSFVWFAKALDEATFVREKLPLLKKAAKSIGDGICFG